MSSSKKRTYKVVTVDSPRVSVVYIEADKMVITTSGALCFYEHRKSQTDAVRKLSGAYHLTEAHAPRTWKHVVEEGVEAEDRDVCNDVCQADEKDFLRQDSE